MHEAEDEALLEFIERYANDEVLDYPEDWSLS